MRDQGWRGKWVNGHGRWTGSLGFQEDFREAPKTASIIESEKPKYLTLYDANGKALGPDRRLGFIVKPLIVLLLLAAVTACNHKTHHIRGVPSIVPCDDGDNASPIGEGHHDKPCKDDRD